jgi:hypothetical protein
MDSTMIMQAVRSLGGGGWRQAKIHAGKIQSCGSARISISDREDFLLRMGEIKKDVR